MEQDKIMQIQILENEINQLDQHLQLVNQNISEMQELENSLKEIDKKECKEILVDIGKKVYLPVKIKEKKLTLEVGGKNFIKKTIPETIKVLKEQENKLIETKVQVINRLEEAKNRIELLIDEIQKKKSKEQ